ncbi:MAG: hypothetical protein P0Y55_17725 [Candidatus Cohnella colombiensis]|uniref:ParB/Sulfiredoxin domain-containing protein n=1 Tax=Candidatus Cohnella colombiensis TaxID=3121368 RepID=A0AA95EWV5_9BACL|nr:MAG: hypothetical protein P0Y55_17725 [Cohnella sp.]
MGWHSHHVNGKRHTWNVERLYPLAMELPSVRVKINSIPGLDGDCWFKDASDPRARIPSVRNVAQHFKQMLDADLSYPIIISANGQHLVDGNHRVAKCLAYGHEDIEAVYMELPEPDQID